jgi:hypothetical protein
LLSSCFTPQDKLMQNPKHIYILSLKTVWRYPRGNQSP